MITTLISILISICVALFIAKWQMKRNRIVHFSINSYDIGKGLSDMFPDFQLNYGNENLSNNVMVLKGGFMNTGRNDIDTQNGVSDFKLILPKGCVVKAIKVLPSTSDLKINENVNNNIISFSICDVFKSDEFFKYTAIAESNEAIDGLHEKLKFQHRILNTEKIQNTFIGRQIYFFKKKSFRLMLFLLLLMSFILLFLSFYQKVSFKIVHNSTNTEVKLYIDPQSNLYVNDGNLFPFINNTIISEKEFYKDYRIEPITVFRWNRPELIIAILEFSLLAILLCLIYFSSRLNNHILNVIKANENSEKE